MVLVFRYQDTVNSYTINLSKYEVLCCHTVAKWMSISRIGSPPLLTLDIVQNWTDDEFRPNFELVKYLSPDEKLLLSKLV